MHLYSCENIQVFLKSKSFVWFDCFLLFQISKLVADVQPVSVEVEWVPIVLGALFQKIGTPMVSFHCFQYICCVCLFVCLFVYLFLHREHVL